MKTVTPQPPISPPPRGVTGGGSGVPPSPPARRILGARVRATMREALPEPTCANGCPVRVVESGDICLGCGMEAEAERLERYLHSEEIMADRQIGSIIDWRQPIIPRRR